MFREALNAKDSVNEIIVSGNANEKRPCSGYRTFIPAKDARKRQARQLF
jgi:hypothetical protein